MPAARCGECAAEATGSPAVIRHADECGESVRVAGVLSGTCYAGHGFPDGHAFAGTAAEVEAHVSTGNAGDLDRRLAAP